MSLFGTSPPDENVNPSMHSSFARSRHGLFDDEGGISRTNSDHLFDAEDDDDDSTTADKNNSNNSNNNNNSGAPTSPWDMPSPRKKKTRAELLRSLLPASDVPDAYIDVFEAAVRDEDGGSTKNTVSAGGVARALAASKLDADSQAAIMNVIAPGGSNTTGDDGASTIALGRNEFNVLLALIGLAQEGEVISLDSVDERRRSELLSSFLSGNLPFRFCFPVSFFPSQHPLPILIVYYSCAPVLLFMHRYLISLHCPFSLSLLIALCVCCYGGESEAICAIWWVWYGCTLGFSPKANSCIALSSKQVFHVLRSLASSLLPSPRPILLPSDRPQKQLLLPNPPTGHRPPSPS